MRKAIAFWLMLLMSVPAFTSSMPGEQRELEPAKLSENELKRQSALKEKAELFGLGAEIRVVMRGGSAGVKNEGVMENVSADGIQLKIIDKHTTILYGQMESLSLKQSSYKTAGTPDPVQVRRVAADIGIGNKATFEYVDEALARIPAPRCYRYLRSTPGKNNVLLHVVWGIR